MILHDFIVAIILILMLGLIVGGFAYGFSRIINAFS